MLGLNDYPREDKRYKDVKPFGELLRKILKETGTSQYEFTQKADVSWGIFYNWLAGKSRPSVYNLAKIAAYFGCSVHFWRGRVKAQKNIPNKKLPPAQMRGRQPFSSVKITADD